MTPTGPRTPPRTSPRPDGDLVVERVPWSVLGPGFVEVWGRFDPRNPQPEHMECIGQNGSGKSFFIGQVMAEMTRRRDTNFVFVATKPADRTISSMGLETVDTVREQRRLERCLFWPRTSRTGRARTAYQASRIQELLDSIWADDQGNITVIFDEFARVESMTPDLKETLGMYLREGRSHGITVVAGKQRAQGVNRDLHAETRVTVVFPVKDDDDKERLAQVLGNRRALLPVMRTLSLKDHEFILKHEQADSLFISWIDKPVDVAAVMKAKRSYRR